MSRDAKIAISALLLAALFFGTLKPEFYLILGMDRSILRESIESGPDSRAPGYDDFLAQVAEAIPRGEVVALLTPDRLDGETADYRFYRASYFLAGRSVKRVYARELSSAKDIRYFALWPGDPSVLPFNPILHQGGGTLFERR